MERKLYHIFYRLLSLLLILPSFCLPLLIVAQESIYVDQVPISIGNNSKIVFHSDVEISGLGGEISTLNFSDTDVKGALVLKNNATASNSGKMSVADTLHISKVASFTNADALHLGGLFVSDAGSIFVNQKDVNVDSSVLVRSGSTLNTLSGSTMNTGISGDNSSKFYLETATLNNKGVIRVAYGDASIVSSSAVDNANTFQINNGKLSVTSSSFENSAEVIIDKEYLELDASTFDNRSAVSKLIVTSDVRYLTIPSHADLNISGSSKLQNTGSVLVRSSILISDKSSYTSNGLNASLSILNTGDIRMENSSSLSSAGLIEVKDGGIFNGSKSSISNLSGGKVTLKYNLISEGNSTIENQGKITLEGEVNLKQSQFTNNTGGGLFVTSKMIFEESTFQNFDSVSVNDVVSVSNSSSIFNNTGGNFEVGSFTSEKSYIKNDAVIKSIKGGFSLLESTNFLNAGNVNLANGFVMSTASTFSNSNSLIISSGGASLYKTASFENKSGNTSITGNLFVESAQFVNRAAVEVYNGNLSVSDNAAFVNFSSGVFTAAKEGLLNNGSSLINRGAFTLAEGLRLTNASLFSNLSGSLTLLKNGLYLSTTSSVDNEASIIATGGVDVGSDATFTNKSLGSVSVTDKLFKAQFASSKFESEDGSEIKFEGDSVIVRNVFSFYNLKVNSRKAVLHNQGVISVAGDLSVFPNKKLTSSEPGLKIEVLKTFTNSGDVELLSGLGKQGEIYLPEVVSGSIKIQKYIQEPSAYWISSPVISPFDELLRDGRFNPDYVKYWDAKVADLVPVLNMSSRMSTAASYRIEFGQKLNGFISISSVPAPIELRGNPNVNDANIDLWYSAGDKSTSEVFRSDIATTSKSGWNSFGNPFPVTIDWEKVDKTPLISPALYQLDVYGKVSLYNQGISINSGSNFLSPFAGAKVRVSKSGNLLIPKSARDIKRAGKRASVPTNIPIIKLKFEELTSTGVATDYLYDECAFVVVSSPTHQSLNYDAYKHIHPNKEIPNLYIATDTASFSIMTLGESSISVPLSFQTNEVGKKYRVTAELKNIDPLWTVLLQDNLVRGLRDLRKPYEFISTQSLTSGSNSRFTFYLNQDESVFNIEKSYSYVEDEEVHVVILELDDNAKIYIYNSYGQLLFSAENVSDRETIFRPSMKRNVNRQVFIVKTVIKGVTYTSRVIY